MFSAFFPKPKLFFISAAVWSGILIALWHYKLSGLADFSSKNDESDQVKSLSILISAGMAAFIIYFMCGSLVFYLFWKIFYPHKYETWSVLGSALIIFVIYFNVQCGVAINNWSGKFFDTIQYSLSNPGKISIENFNSQFLTLLIIASIFVLSNTLMVFFISHYVFRWREAMNDYYMKNWPIARTVEGAAQRVQDDTMRFASIMQDLGAGLSRPL